SHVGNQYRAVSTTSAGSTTTTAAMPTMSPPTTSDCVSSSDVCSSLRIDTGGSTSFTALIQSPCSTSNTQKFTLTAAPPSGWYYRSEERRVGKEGSTGGSR